MAVVDIVVVDKMAVVVRRVAPLFGGKQRFQFVAAVGLQGPVLVAVLLCLVGFCLNTLFSSSY